MRAFTWLLTAAMGVLCFSCWAMAELAMRSVRDMGSPLPNITSLVLRSHTWLLLMPIPWIIYSGVLSFRRELSARAVFIFAGTIGFTMTSVVCAVVVAGLLPFIPLKIGQ